MPKAFDRGLGCPQQAERANVGGEVWNGKIRKDIPFHCLPKTDIYHYRANVPSDYSRHVPFSIRGIFPFLYKNHIFHKIWTKLPFPTANTIGESLDFPTPS